MSATLNDLVVDLNTHLTPTFQDLITFLGDAGYRRVPMVLEQGDFAVRGGIVDVFPSRQTHPLRFDFHGDELERLNSFLIHTQRSLSTVQETRITSFSQSEPYFFASSDDSAVQSLLSEYQEDDYVVHEMYGIGQFKRLTRLKMAQHEGEFLLIQYKGTDVVYVPLDQIHLIHKYSGSDVVPKLNGLNDGAWKRTTNKVKKETETLAFDIFLLYQQRKTQEGFSFNEDTVWQIDLENSFKHAETPDQIKVSRDIKNDMESSKPMDRLLCGDVGFGKTEVLVRAAFKAVENGKQVAILVPTTVLAQQHFRTFSERFKAFPYIVDWVSRFKSAIQNKKTLQGLKHHKIDVVIGTHRLLSKDVEFSDLGLLVVDEEQRFGVSHKEKIKAMKANVDALSVSATPIPRTLYMAMTGARDFSNIETPPPQKKPVLTLVSEISDEKLANAISYEIERGGQVYYIFNNVAAMPQKYHALKTLLPHISIAMAHGQMSEHVLEATMNDFYENKYQVLLCSTIIESGLDIPNVNTIVIDRADHLGLSQIHQLRGRVGRGEKQGYCYLFYPSEDLLSEKSRKRLQAVREYAALGSGYKLALKDLELRGAGTLLGKKQHGHMTSIGFELYCQLLADSVAKIQGKKLEQAKSPIKPFMEGYIPESYIEDYRERLAMYQRLSKMEYKTQLDSLIIELEDRYGEMPDLLRSFLNVIEVQLDG